MILELSLEHLVIIYKIKTIFAQMINHKLTSQQRVTHIVMLLLVTIFFSCNNKNTESIVDIGDKKKEALAFAASVLGAKSEVIPNEDGSYFLCVKESTPKVIYAVTDLQSNVILKTQSVRGKVEWYDSGSIIVKERPGIIEDKRAKPSDYHRIIKLKEEH